MLICALHMFTKMVVTNRFRKWYKETTGQGMLNSIVLPTCAAGSCVLDGKITYTNRVSSQKFHGLLNFPVYT